jgi:hypothetical protein
VFAVSWLCLAVAVVSLVLGLSREGLMLVYVSIGASVAAMLFLLAGVVRKPSGGGPPPGRSGKDPAASERPT